MLVAAKEKNTSHAQQSICHCRCSRKEQKAENARDKIVDGWLNKSRLLF